MNLNYLLRTLITPLELLFAYPNKLAQFTTLFDHDPNSLFIEDVPFSLAQNLQ